METFSALLAICAGNSPVSGEFPAQRPVTRSFSLICVWINGWVNNAETGDDLRRHRAHYDVIVMMVIRAYCFKKTAWFPTCPHIFPMNVFVKLEELHIATARKPLIHQNQPVAWYLHKKQPCMLWFMLVGLQHRTLSSKLSSDNQVIGNFCIPADSTNAFGDLSVHKNFRLLYSGLFFSMLRGAK